MSPSTITVERDYFNHFDIKDFFSFTNPVKTIVPLIFSSDPVTYAAVYSPIPSWLIFD